MGKVARNHPKPRRRPANGGKRQEPNVNGTPRKSPAAPVNLRAEWPRWALGGLLLAAAFVWAYWPTLIELVRTWEREPDYSHGYLVLPVAILFLWARRDTFPGFRSNLIWPGMLLIGISLAMRYGAALVYIDAVDGWSILVWAAGVAWLLGGWKLAYWCWPSIAFLAFMIPLPYRTERWLSLPLQRVATKLSCWSLQILGQPALPEGNTIWLSGNQLEVEDACSGMRIFVGIIALAFVYLVLVRQSWWHKLLLIASILPIALISNATRIVVTGLLFQFTTSDLAHRFTHDVAGWAMMPLAAALFGLVVWYINLLVYRADQVSVGELVRRERKDSPPQVQPS